MNIEVALQTERTLEGDSTILLTGTHTKEQKQILIDSTFKKQVIIQGEPNGSNQNITISLFTDFIAASWLKLAYSSMAGLSIQNVNISLQPSSPSSGYNPSFQASLFEISSHLVLNSILFSSTTSAPSLLCCKSLIPLYCGSISFTGVKFENFTLINSSLISWTSGDIYNPTATSFHF